jgi:HAE1 family hydrophobic/amphiphilic exporter-1
MFSGLFIVSGVIGQFIFSIPFTIIFLLLASIFVALFIVPLIASQFLRRRSTTKLEQKQNELSRRLEGWYRHKLDCIIGNKRLERRFIWGVRAGLVGAILLPVIGLVPVVFFEQGDVDFVIVQLENAEGTVKEVTDIGIRRVEEFLYDKPYIESFSTTVGSGSQFAGGSAGEKFANITVNLREDRDVTSTEVIDAIRTDLAVLSDLNVTVDQPSDGPPTGAAVVIKFLGDDLSALTRLANESANVLRNIPNTVNIETSTNNNNTEFVINLDNAKATALGVSPSQVSQVARTALFGADATSLTTLNDSIDVVVKLNLDGDPTITADTSNQISISDLERLTFSSPTGPVTLSSVADVTLRESSTVINHEDGERVVSVTANVGPEGNAREIQATAVERIQSEVAIPDGITLSTGGGEAEESNEAFIEMFLALIIGIGLMVGILILQFNSFLHTRYVLSILPYSLIGVLGGLAITQNPLSFPSIMGFIALSGIVVNNSILLIDMMNNLRRKDMTRPIKDVVLDAATNRLRPILLTTITTIFGVVPLLFAGSIWVPLVYALIFGLLFAVVITLFTIPITYARKPGSLPGQIDMVASTDQTVQYK